MSDSSSSSAVAPSTDRRGAVLDLVPAGIFETDDAGQCRYVNRRWEAYTGLSAECAFGSGWIDAIHPADRAHVVAAWNASVISRSELDLEFRFLRADGTTIWAAGHASPIRAIDGRVTGYIGTVTDVTAAVE